ncbi:hypothetical protein GQX73_g4042 [Xylaria multiplex]|uniref:Uncharacterized protein n=1 Tax=Xylaria multiplex TaxID=323545 RepID=A0A7C8IRQ8_9PEZI|nr:hypothetical protein GQX73_g4042 [Xylaria multiplex]
MLFFNPLKFFVLPLVFIVALPLALCAGVTTIIAFLVLFLRLFLVYFDVGLETLQYALIGHSTHARYITSHGTPATTPGSSTNSTTPPSPAAAATTFRYRRRAKQQGGGDSGLATPVPAFNGFAAVTPRISLERDFEGVGGWRLESVDVDTDGTDEQQWCNLNSRLENPYRRHHFRSQSGGAVIPTGSKATVRLGSVTRPHSPDESKTPSRSSSRTPTMSKHQWFTKAERDDYFPLYEGKNMKKLGI